MSRDLVAAVNDRNFRELVGPNPREFRLGPDRAMRILAFLADHANAVGEVWWSTASCARELGLARWDVQNGYALWEHRGVIVRTGARRELGGVVVYRFTDPDDWPAEAAPRLTLLTVPRAPQTAEVDGQIHRTEVDGQLDGQVDGQLDGHVRHEREGEAKQRVGFETEPHLAPKLTDKPPTPCQRHPNGWHHAEKCGRCASMREWDAAQRAASPATRARRDDEFCGSCDRGWVETPTGAKPCPSGCLDPIALSGKSATTTTASAPPRFVSELADRLGTDPDDRPAATGTNGRTRDYVAMMRDRSRAATKGIRM